MKYRTPPLAYPFEAYDRNLCLKPSLGMFLVLSYSVRHLLIVFLLYFPFMIRSVDMATLKHWMATPLGVSLAVADLPALLIWLAWRYRRPRTGTAWRWLWRRGRLALLATLITQGALLMVTQAEKLLTSGEEGAFLVIYLMIQGWALTYVGFSRRLTDVFRDFPDPAVEGDAATAPTPGQAPSPKSGKDTWNARKKRLPAPLSRIDWTPTRIAEESQKRKDKCIEIASKFMIADAPEQVMTMQQRLADSSPAVAAAWYTLSIRAASQGALAEATLLIETALRLDPHNGRYLRNLCEIYRRLGRPAAAVAAGEAAVQRQPDTAAHYNLALALAETGQIEAACHHYRIVLQMNPAHGRAWNNLGIIYQQQGDRVAAQYAFQQALVVAPGLAVARRNLEELVQGARQPANHPG
ncbi:MAG TPA: DUF2919 family protein [Candidatus Competibacteraceae bacterium]|nr:DUF2919 family protein [Candidatus Competibacteraceae bacterium]